MQRGKSVALLHTERLLQPRNTPAPPTPLSRSRGPPAALDFQRGCHQNPAFPNFTIVEKGAPPNVWFCPQDQSSHGVGHFSDLTSSPSDLEQIPGCLGVGRGCRTTHLPVLCLPQRLGIPALTVLVVCLLCAWHRECKHGLQLHRTTVALLAQGPW